MPRRPVGRCTPGPSTTSTSLRVSSEDGYRPLGRGRFSHGTVVVTSHVHSYLRRRADTFQVIGSEPLDLPASSLSTSACWWALPDAELRDFDDLAGAVHAAEHAAIGLLPFVVSCDRWDVGGLSTEAHTTRTRVERDSPAEASTGWTIGCRPPGRPSSSVPAREGAPDASRVPNAAMATSRSTKLAQPGCLDCWSDLDRSGWTRSGSRRNLARAGAQHGPDNDHLHI